ncbi:MAG: putative peptidoglycan glycosyltransferase FtsW [Acidimicrobiales bacterium]
MAIRQRDLRHDSRGRPPAPAPRTRERGLFQPMPRGVASGRVLLLITTLLVTFGTIAVASASEGQASANGGSTWSIMIHDLVYLGFGIFALYVMSRVRLERLVRSAPILILVGLGLLLAVRAIGVSSNGGTRWLNLHVIYLQPSEMFKLFTVLFIAWLVQHHHDELGHWRQLALWTVPVTFGCALIVIEPDIGTTSVVVVIAFAMLAVGGLSRKMLVRITLLVLTAFGAYMVSKPYSASRFWSFLHPNNHLLSGGYQLLQSRIGLGAGGVAGLGLGHSREKWGLLPNPHTDFIFTIIGEELGLIGTLVVIALFIAFVFAAVRIAQQCTNSVYRLVAVGITTWIAVEALINIASVVGWWAVTGIPLPFFSYGGTALITELAAVGLLYNIAHDRSHSGDVTIRERRLTNFRETIERKTAPRPAPRSRSTNDPRRTR